MKRLAVLFALGLALAGFGFAQKDRADIRVVVVTHGAASDPFWTVVKSGVDQAAKDTGAQVEYRSPETFDMPAMAQLIDGAVASAPDAIVISLPDATALGDSVKKAVAAGIPVFSINSGSNDFEALGILRHFGQTELEAGMGAGEQLKAAGGTKGLCINQEQGNVALELRCQGFTEGFGDVTVLAVSMDPTEVKNAVTAAINEGGYDTILTLGPTGAEPTMAALSEGGMTGTVKFGTFDLSPAILTAVSDGELLFAIDQQPYLQGYYGVMSAVLYVSYGVLPGPKVLSTGPGFVTKDNAAQVIELAAKGIR